jgi:HSP20 family protein
MTPERRGALAPPPLHDFEQVADRMRRLLDESLGGLPVVVADVAAWTPPVNIEETDDAYVVEAELPGVDRKDVDIELDRNELSITGEIKEKERQGILRKRTRRIGRFEYRVQLPNVVDADSVDAKLEDGVLRVRVPKTERAQRKRIEINK